MLLLLIILAGLCLILALLPRLRRRWQVARWRKRLGLNHYEADFKQLYRQYDGFALSKKAREDQDSTEYLYGEIDFTAFIALLSLCNIDENTVFYDLGSGIGKAVLAAAMVFELKSSCGIELFTPLHQAAQQCLEQLRITPGYEIKSARIDFHQGDIWQADFKDATLVFVNGTAFFAERWQALSLHIAQVASNTLVISTSKALDCKEFNLVAIKPLPMSWGVVNAYIQRKNPIS